MRSQQQPRRSRPSPRPLHVETLEGRCLLSTYTLTDLGSDIFARSINNLGQVAGYMTDPQLRSPRAILWDNGTLTDLGTLGGDSSQALGINDSGQVVGWSQVIPGDPYSIHAFLWDSLNGMQDLGTFGATWAEAIAINNAGQITAANSRGFAFLLTDGTATNLGLGSPYAINNAAQIVGTSTQIAGDSHAILWNGGTSAIDLGTLAHDETSTAWGINDAGVVVGQSEGSFTAFIWEDGQISDLLGGRHGGALGINNAGQVVGVDWNGGAFIFQNGAEAFLNDLVPPSSGLFLLDAYAINDNGQIVVQGTDAGRAYHTVVLTPDGGGAPHAGDPSLFRLPAPAPAVPIAGPITAQPPGSTPQASVPMATLALPPAGAAASQAADTVAAGGHQTSIPALEDGWEIKGLGLFPAAPV